MCEAQGTDKWGLLTVLVAQSEPYEDVGGGRKSCQNPCWIVQAETGKEQDLVSVSILQMRKLQPPDEAGLA